MRSDTFHKVLRDNGLHLYLKPSQTKECLTLNNKTGKQLIKYNDAMRKLTNNLEQQINI